MVNGRICGFQTRKGTESPRFKAILAPSQGEILSVGPVQGGQPHTVSFKIDLDLAGSITHPVTFNAHSIQKITGHQIVSTETRLLIRHAVSKRIDLLLSFGLHADFKTDQTATIQDPSWGKAIDTALLVCFQGAIRIDTDLSITQSRFFSPDLSLGVSGAVQGKTDLHLHIGERGTIHTEGHWTIYHVLMEHTFVFNNT